MSNNRICMEDAAARTRRAEPQAAPAPSPLLAAEWALRGAAFRAVFGADLGPMPGAPSAEDTARAAFGQAAAAARARGLDLATAIRTDPATREAHKALRAFELPTSKARRA